MLTIKVQTIGGQVGTKIFENRKDAITWVKDNSTKLAKIAIVEDAKAFGRNAEEIAKRFKGKDPITGKPIKRGPIEEIKPEWEAESDGK